MKSYGCSCTCSLILILGSAGLSCSWAQDSEIPWEKASLQFGGFATFFNSEVTFGVSGRGNSSINAEDRLGLDSNLTVFRVEALYRPDPDRRNQVDFTYGAYHRDGSTTLSRDLTIDGTTYPVGARIESLFNFDLIRGAYSFAFLQNDRARIALGLGAYALPLEYGLEIETTGGRSRVEGGDTTLPLPVLSLRAEVRLLPKLFLKASADGMYVEMSDFKGSLVDASLGLEYRAWKHFGFGLGYNFVAADVEGKGSSDYPGVDFVGEVNVRFSGLLIYGKLSF